MKKKIVKCQHYQIDVYGLAVELKYCGQQKKPANYHLILSL